MPRNRSESKAEARRALAQSACSTHVKRLLISDALGISKGNAPLGAILVYAGMQPRRRVRLMNAIRILADLSPTLDGRPEKSQHVEEQTQQAKQ